MFLQYEMGDESLHHFFPVLKTKQTPLLPFVVNSMGDFTCDNRYFTKRQGLEQCLLLYTLEGEGLIDYNGTQTVLSPDQLILLDCRNYHYYATKGEHWRFSWLHFSGKCAFDYVDLFNTAGDSPLTIGKRLSFPSYYEQLTSYVLHFDLQRELELSSVMQKLLTELIHLKKTEAFSMKYGSYYSELEDSISYLQKHFTEDISVEQLANRSHLSKYYYIKIFKAYTGQTPYDYLLGLRLQQAQKMLLETNLAVSVLARKSGFSDNKNFIACFKKKVGMTPLQFRKMNAIGAVTDFLQPQ